MDRRPEGRLLHATALVRAKEKGDSPGTDVLRRAMAYLRGIEEHIPGWYGPDARRAIRAYALHVRWLHGETVRGEAMRLIREAGGVESMPLEAFGWLWHTLSGTDGSQDLVRAIRRHVENNVHLEIETATTATPSSSAHCLSFSPGLETTVTRNPFSCI